MARVRVQRYGKQGFADVDTEATKGATLGTNLYRADGTVVTEDDLNPSSDPVARTKTLWELLAKVPANISALASLATDGWIRRDGAAITARALAATDSSYDNTTSGLSATDVQGAVDELKVEIDSGGGGGGGADASAKAYQCWDFIGHGVDTSTATGSSFITTGAVPIAYTSGGAASLATASGVPGYCALSTGTTSAGYSRLFFGPGKTVALGGGAIRAKARFRLPTLSDGTDKYFIVLGFQDVISGSPNCLQLLYGTDFNSGNWRLRAIDGVGTTNVDTAVTGPTGNAWHTAEIVVAADGLSADLLIDDASVATINANIPTTAMGLTVQITKQLGTTARTCDVDFFEFQQSFTTPR